MALVGLEGEVVRVREVEGSGKGWEWELGCRVENGGGAREYLKDRPEVEGGVTESDLEVVEEVEAEEEADTDIHDAQ